MREIVESRGLSAYAVGQLAGVDAGVVSRFMTGERDIRLETAERIGAALGLRLIEVARAKGRVTPARRLLPSDPHLGPDPGPVEDDAEQDHDSGPAD